MGTALAMQDGGAVVALLCGPQRASSGAVPRTVYWLVALLLLASATAQADQRVQISSNGASRTLVLDHVLGSGGLGTTYDAHDVADPAQHFAVKVLHSNSAGALQDLLHEHDVLQKLAQSSNHFIKSYGTGEEVDGQHRPAFAMELLQGKPLGGTGPGRGWNAPLHLPAGKAVRVARRLLEQLGEMHAAGLVHGDVHTANVRINDALHSWTARLVDFGTTHAYSAADGRDDVINVARILLENLSGKLFNDPRAFVVPDSHRAVVRGGTVRLGNVLRDAMAGKYGTTQALDAALAPFAAIAP